MRLVESLVKIYQESVGEVVVFRWVEWLKDQGWMWKEADVWMQKHIPPGPLLTLHSFAYES